MKKNKNYEFIMDTDWLFNGILDAEQKQYILLDYFQKMSKFFDDMKVYPMFIEISLHLGNIQTLLTQNKILYTDKVFKEPDEELLLVDLKVKDIPVLTEEEVVEYHKILNFAQTQILDYFNFVKSLWTVVYDSIDVKIRKNKSNLKSNIGFFYYNTPETLYIWKYVTRRVPKTKNQNRTKLSLIYSDSKNDLTIQEIISKFSKTYDKNNEELLPILEVTCDNDFPLRETLVPIFKRKVISYIIQGGKLEKFNKTIS